MPNRWHSHENQETTTGHKPPDYTAYNLGDGAPHNIPQGTQEELARSKEIAEELLFIPFQKSETRASQGTTFTFSSWRADLYHILHERKGEKRLAAIGYYLNWFFFLNTVVSIIVLVLATLHRMWIDYVFALSIFSLDAFCTSIFVIELTLHIIGRKNWRSLIAWRYAIDVLSIIPFFIEFFALLAKFGRNNIIFNAYNSNSQTYVLNAVRVIRTFRILRLFNYFRRYQKMQMMGRAFKQSIDGILLLLGTLPLLVVFFSTLLYYAEQTNGYFQDGIWYYSGGTRSPYQSIPDCFWLVIVTLTTIGYGDVVPQSTAGKLVMTLVMIMSLFIVAFPLTMITIQYSNVYRAYEQRLRKKNFEKKLREKKQQESTCVNEEEHSSGEREEEHPEDEEEDIGSIVEDKEDEENAEEKETDEDPDKIYQQNTSGNITTDDSQQDSPTSSAASQDNALFTNDDSSPTSSNGSTYTRHQGQSNNIRKRNNRSSQQNIANVDISTLRRAYDTTKIHTRPPILLKSPSFSNDSVSFQLNSKDGQSPTSQASSPSIPKSLFGKKVRVIHNTSNHTNATRSQKHSHTRKNHSTSTELYQEPEILQIQTNSQTLNINSEGYSISGKSNTDRGVDIWEMEREVENTCDGGTPDVVVMKICEWGLKNIYVDDGEEEIMMIKVKLKDDKKFREFVNMLASFQ